MGFLAKEGVFFYACCVFVVTLPFPIPVNNISIFVLVVAWISSLGNKASLASIIREKDFRWIVALFLVYFLSLSYTDNFQDGLSRVETKLSLVAFPIIFSTAVIRRVEIWTLMKLFFVSLVLISITLLILAAYRFMQTGSVEELYYHRLTSPLGLNAIYFANYWGLAFLYLVLYKPFRLFFLIPALLFSFIMIILLSALSVTAFLVCFLVYCAFRAISFPSRLRSILIISCSGLLLVFLLVYSIPGMKTKVAKIKSLEYQMDYEDYQWNSITIRLAMWKSAISQSIKSPFFGCGIGDENDVLQESYRVHNFKEGIRCNYNTHNQYLSTFLSVGITGLLVLLVMIFAPMIKAYQTNDQILFFFLCLICMSFLSENFLSTQKGVVFFAFFYSIFVKSSVQTVS